MRKYYEEPEFEMIQVQLSNVILSPSTSTFQPEEPIGEDIIDDEP